MSPSIKVLIVDDEQDFASALAERLELRNMETRLAPEAEHAKQLLDEEVPDVVLLDVQLPGESGLELLEEIKQAHPCLPVLLLTGRGGKRKDLGEQALKAFRCLSKPVDMEGLLRTIRQAIDESHENATQ